MKNQAFLIYHSLILNNAMLHKENHPLLYMTKVFLWILSMRFSHLYDTMILQEKV